MAVMLLFLGVITKEEYYDYADRGFLRVLWWAVKGKKGEP